MNLFRKVSDNELVFADGYFSDANEYQCLAMNQEFTADEIKYGINYVNGAVVIDTDRKAADEAAADEAFNQNVKDKLVEIDIKSVRSIREWLVEQEGCPEFLVDHESEAQAERAKLK